MPCQQKLVTFYPKPFNLLGCLFISCTLEFFYFCILLLEIVALWDYYYRIESTRKCIRSCSPTTTVSKAHNFFSRGDTLLNFVVLYTLECWLQDQVDRKSFHNVSNFAPNVLTFPWPGPRVLACSQVNSWPCIPRT